MSHYFPNSPMSRLQYVVKTYEKQPVVVRDTLRVAFNMLGIHGVNFQDLVYGQHDAYSAYLTLNTPTIQALLTTHAQRLARYFKYDVLFPWVARELQRLRKREADGSQGFGYYDIQLQDLIMRGTAIAQWAEANRVDLTKLDLNMALQESRDWEAPVAVIQGYTVYEEFGDGWTVQQLVSYEELASEGEVMQHCVGEYGERVDCGRVTIYSLRDPRGRPHVTMEYDNINHRFKQIYGKQNDPPKEAYAVRVREFIENQFDGEPGGMLMAGADPRKIDLRGARLSGIDLSNADLSGVDLSDAGLTQSTLYRTNFYGANLHKAHLRHANLNHADLRGADLTNANLADATLHRVRLTGANLQNADLRRATMGEADLQNANLVDANLDRVDLAGAYLQGAQVTGANLSGAYLRGAHIEGVDFTNTYWNDETQWPSDVAITWAKRQPRENLLL